MGFHGIISEFGNDIFQKCLKIIRCMYQKRKTEFAERESRGFCGNLSFTEKGIFLILHVYVYESRGFPTFEEARLRKRAKSNCEEVPQFNTSVLVSLGLNDLPVRP